MAKTPAPAPAPVLPAGHIKLDPYTEHAIAQLEAAVLSVRTGKAAVITFADGLDRDREGSLQRDVRVTTVLLPAVKP